MLSWKNALNLKKHIVSGTQPANGTFTEIPQILPEEQKPGKNIALQETPILDSILDEAAILRNTKVTVACYKCRKPLWAISNLIRYGSDNRFSYDCIAYPGVPEYKDMWESDRRTPKEIDCPHCGEPYMKGVPLKDKDPMALFYIPEWEELKKAY